MAKQASDAAKTAGSEHINLLLILKGIVVSYLITIPTFIIFAFMLTYTDFPEKYISPAVIITTIISLLTAGSTVTRHLKSRGWLNGAIVGVVYMLVLYLFSSLVIGDFSVSRYTVSMIVLGILTASLGGIIGINLKKSIRTRIKR